MLLRVRLGCLVLGFLLAGAGPGYAQETGRVTGTVLAEYDAQPVAGVNVVVVGTLYAAVTDAEGQFMLGPMPPGTYAVEVNALGYASLRRDVAVAAGQDTALLFQLRLPEVEVEQVEEAAWARDWHPVAGIAASRLRELDAQATDQLVRSLPGGDAGRRGAMDFDPVIRGVRGPQLGVYIDGARWLAESPYGLDAPLHALEPQAITSVEVLKGPYALTLGAGNLSVIRVETPSPDTGGVHGSMLAGYATRLRAYEAAGTVAGAVGKAAYRLDGAVRGGNDYKDGSGRVVPADARAATARGQVAYRFAKSSRLVVRAGYQDRDDLDVPDFVLGRGATEAANASVHFQTAWAVGLLRALDVQGYWNRRAQHLEAHPQDVPGTLLELEAEQVQVGGRVVAQLEVHDGWSLSVGGDVYSIGHDATRRDDVPSPLMPTTPVLQEARVTDGGLFAGATRTMGRVEATGAVRVDFVQSRAVPAADAATEAQVSGAVGVTVHLAPAWRVSAGLGSAARTADAYERYAGPSPSRRLARVGDVQGNPTLAPERSTQVDVGLNAAYSRVALRLSAFARRLHDYIRVVASLDQLIPPSEALPVTSYVNSDATVYGTEAWIRYALMGEFVQVHLAASYLRGRDSRYGEPLFGIAPIRLEMGGRVQAPANLFFLEGVIRGALAQKRVATSLGEIASAGYLTADLRLGVSLPRSASLWLGIDNLANTTYTNHLNPRHPVELRRITEPGRVAYARLRYAF